MKKTNMKMIDNFINNRKEEYRKRRDEAIRESFDITERGGCMWLTHNGVAFMKVASLANAADIAKTLNDARDCALEFERL